MVQCRTMRTLADRATGSPTDTPQPGASPAGGNAMPLSTGYWVSRYLALAAVRLAFRLRVEGAEHLPSGPFLLVATHRSWVDGYALAAALPLQARVAFLAD